MIEINVRTNFKDLEKSLNAFANKQLPFATASALTALARTVQGAEKASMSVVFDRPTPFTLNSIGVKGARKDTLEAEVFIKDIAAAYLKPYEVGGMHKLVGRNITWFNPKDKTLLDQYGNLSKSKLAQLKARSDIFIGGVKGKDGRVINGVWQRSADAARLVGKAGKVRKTFKGINTTGHLKLLLRFGDAIPVHKHWDFAKRAESIVQKNFNREMGKALAKAIATAK